MRIATTIAAVAAVLVMAGAALGAPPSFQGLGILGGGDSVSHANAVSRNGQYVVGYTGPYYTNQAFRWSAATGMVALGTIPGDHGSVAYGVSNDGNTVATSSSSNISHAGVWKSGAGMSSLGYVLPGYAQGWAKCVSADGAILGGVVDYPGTWIGFQWTQASGMVALTPASTLINTCSADGSVMAGYIGSDAGLWTQATGVVSLGRLPITGHYGSAQATGLSADGSIVVGYDGQGGSQSAFRWTQGTGMIELSHLAGGPRDGQATGVSADGQRIVGWCSTLNNGSPVAVVWDPQGSVRRLQDILTLDYGMDLTGWTLKQATGISDDGGVIVGWGLDPAGKEEAFVAVLPEPATLSLLALGALAVLRKRRK